MDERLIIDVARLDPEGEILEGEADVIDIDEEFVKPFGGVRYRLKAQVIGTELLIKGRLEQDFDLVCCRCGKDFDDTVKVEDFLESVEIGENPNEIDISDLARESVLLALPNFPVCAETCPGVETKRPEDVPDARWGALDALGKTK